MVMKKLQKSDQQQLWAEAQRPCRLSDEGLRMAEDLGLGPWSLIKNVPSPKEHWKAPVEDWVCAIYEKRQKTAARRPGSPAAAKHVNEEKS